MKDKKIIILIVLGAAAVISLLYGLMSSPKGRRAPAAAQDISQTHIRTPTAPVSIQRHAARTTFHSSPRSPFQATAAPAAGMNLVLNGIIGGKSPKAMIGDAMVGVGDRIGSNTVVAIKSDRVVLNDGTKDFEVVMKQ